MTVRLRSLRPGDLGWVVQRHGVRYAEESGFDQTFEALTARVVADYVRDHVPGDDAWIAELDGEPVGSVFCVRVDESTAKLRLLLVEPAARGLGVGRALVDECVRSARAAGYRRLALWTVADQVAARRIYRRAGFVRLDETPQRLFGRDVVGENWELTL
ncbi:GNAT family N-acetyltransferase [Actinosynnema sp. NPDC020468]|uniref:GNAT family N-acetyltransferase n=1 Tax=Actinosynnema sp. NPDC020468 TaxID=3154488 RepID=UPI0033E3D2B6